MGAATLSSIKVLMAVFASLGSIVFACNGKRTLPEHSDKVSAAIFDTPAAENKFFTDKKLKAYWVQHPPKGEQSICTVLFGRTFSLVYRLLTGQSHVEFSSCSVISVLQALVLAMYKLT